jgi:hypothetical protein
MSISKHVRLLAIASFAWLAFWIAGLPNYYKQYSDNFMLWLVLFLIVPAALISVFVLCRIHPRRRLMVALWMAFYFTVPLALYDWIYCGVYLGYGLNFFVEFWYLTAYYIIPWLLLPASAVLLNGLRAKQRDVGSDDRINPL